MMDQQLDEATLAAIEITEDTVLVLRLPSRADCDAAQAFARSITKSLHDRGLRSTVPVIWLSGDADLRAMNEREMAEYGWVRAPQQEGR